MVLWFDYKLLVYYLWRCSESEMMTKHECESDCLVGWRWRPFLFSLVLQGRKVEQTIIVSLQQLYFSLKKNQFVVIICTWLTVLWTISCNVDFR